MTDALPFTRDRDNVFSSVYYQQPAAPAPKGRMTDDQYERVLADGWGQYAARSAVGSQKYKSKRGQIKTSKKMPELLDEGKSLYDANIDLGMIASEEFNEVLTEKIQADARRRGGTGDYASWVEFVNEITAGESLLMEHLAKLQVKVFKNLSMIGRQRARVVAAGWRITKQKHFATILGSFLNKNDTVANPKIIRDIRKRAQSYRNLMHQYFIQIGVLRELEKSTEILAKKFLAQAKMSNYGYMVPDTYEGEPAEYNSLSASKTWADQYVFSASFASAV